MGVLIDASVLIAAERGTFDPPPALRRRAASPTGIAAITAAELLHGVHRADSAARRHRREAWVEGFLVSLAVFPFDLRAARIYGRLSAELAGAGLTVGPHDLQVAATALAFGFAVATRDLRSFPRIPGLVVEPW